MCSSEKYPYPPHQRNYKFLSSPNHLEIPMFWSNTTPHQEFHSIQGGGNMDIVWTCTL